MNALSRSECEGLEYLVLDSDIQSLAQITHCKAIQIGKKHFVVLEQGLAVRWPNRLLKWKRRH